jgi:hypothetical protein
MRNTYPTSPPRRHGDLPVRSRNPGSSVRPPGWAAPRRIFRDARSRVTRGFSRACALCVSYVHSTVARVGRLRLAVEHAVSLAQLRRSAPPRSTSPATGKAVASIPTRPSGCVGASTSIPYVTSLDWLRHCSYSAAGPANDISEGTQSLATSAWEGTMFKRRLSALCMLLLALILAETASAQGMWRTLSTAGYGTAGLIIATGPAFADGSYGAIAYFPLGFAAGAVVGWNIGGSADRKLAEDEPLTSLHRNAIRAGTVLTGAGAGALVSALLIKPDGPSSIGSDETIFFYSVAGGTALGIVTQVLLDSRLHPTRPLQVGLITDSSGRPGMALRYTF